MNCAPAWSGWAVCREVREDGEAIPIWELRSLDGGETRPAPWIGPDDPVGWSRDGRHAFVVRATEERPLLHVCRVDAATGRRETWLDVSPPESEGVSRLVSAVLTPDGRYYAYSYFRELSDLFLVEGLR